MAINRGTKKPKKVIPEALDKMILEGMTYSALKKSYEEAGKGVKKDIVEYLENNDDGFEVEISKSFSTDHGAVNFKQRANLEVDNDVLIEAVNSGKVALATLLSMGKFDGKKLQEIGLEEAVTVGAPTEYLELRPSKELVSKVESAMVPKETPVAPPAGKPAKKARSKKSAEAIAAAVRLKTLDVDDDLDAILAED